MKLKKLDISILDSYKNFGMYFDYILPLNVYDANRVFTDTIKIENMRMIIELRLNNETEKTR